MAKSRTESINSIAYVRKMFETGRRPANTKWEGAKWGDTNSGPVAEANANFDSLSTRAIYVKDKPAIFKASTIHHEAEDEVGLTPTVRNTIGTDDVMNKQLLASELNQRQG